MPVINQRYALVTEQGWDNGLNEIWPDAPLYGGYRMLVFAGADLPQVESEYSAADFKYLEATETIEQMESGATGPFICNLEQAREIAKHFTPEEGLTNGN